MIPNPTAAPVPVTLSNGEIFLCSPLTVSDQMSLLKYARQHELSIKLSAIPQDVPESMRTEMIRIAYESSNQMDISDEKLWEEPEMIQRAIFLSIRRKHPNITISTVSAITNNPETWRRFWKRSAELRKAPNTHKKKRRSDV